MLTLEELIKHCEQVADSDCYNEEQLRSAEEHRQFARWLTLLKHIIDSGDCNSCMFKGMCATEPGLGQMVRYNCYGYVKKENYDEKDNN